MLSECFHWFVMTDRANRLARMPPERKLTQQDGDIIPGFSFAAANHSSSWNSSRGPQRTGRFETA
jgi:hypothetical protein